MTPFKRIVGLVQVDEDFTWPWLGHVELDDLGRDLAWLIVDGCLVLLW